jgi:protein ImuB
MALVETGARGIVITAVNGTAMAHGIAAGQSLADARAGFPALRTRPAEPARDAAALEELARWAGRYGPSRNTDGCDGLWADISGVAHLFGGETALLADFQRRLTQAGFTARFGLADTVAAAWALARYGNAATSAPVIAPEGKVQAALTGLPVEALRLTFETVVLLKRLGLYQIGQLYGLPRASLARRFRDARKSARARTTDGLADAVVLRLDQALGHIREPRRALAPLPCRLVRQVFAEPLVSSTGIETALAMAVDQLCRMLADAGEGARKVEFTLYRTDGTSAVATIGTSRPSRDSRHIEKLLAGRLGAIDLGFGVDVVTLEGASVEPLDEAQSGFGTKPNAQGAQGIAQLVDRLGNRLGSSAIYRLGAGQSHIPEQADIIVPALAPAVDEAAMPRADLALRPPFLLGRPEPIEVIAEVPEGPPRRFVWRRARHRIVKSEGPERIEPAWWQAIGTASSFASLRPRDYYRVEDDRGGRYWVFREGLYGRETEDGAPGWYVHGLFG